MDTATWGQLGCLTAALCWAFSVTMFRSPIARLGAVPVNFSKSTIAVVMLGATALALGQLDGLLSAPASALGALVLSGWLGLSLGDSALFLAVARLGAHRTLLFQTLAPIFTALLAWLLFGEVMPPIQVAGAAAILAGVAVVVAPARGPLTAHSLPPMSLAGMAWAVVAAFGQGSGVVLTKTAMPMVPIFAAAFVRQAAAGLLLAIVLAALGKLPGALAIFRSGSSFRSVFTPAVLSAYLGFSAMMAGVAWAPASVAAVLLATSPIFSLFIDAWLAGGRITGRGVAGTLVAVAGVALLATG